MPGRVQWEAQIDSNVKQLLQDTQRLRDELDGIKKGNYEIKLNIDEKKLSNVISNLEKMLDSLGKGTGDFKQFENLSKELSSIVSEVQNLSKAFGKVDDSGTKTLLSSIQNIDKSLSELSQHILNVNKNMSNIGGDTNGTVKQVENISNAYDNAAKSAEKLADAQSKLGNKSNISSDSSIRSVLPSDSEFKNVIANLDLTKSKLSEIVKITRQAHADKDGKFYESFTLTDRYGSTETYGESSKTSKGQLLNYKYVEHNAKAAEQEAKALNQAWEEANKVNNALNETKNTLSSLPRMTELDTQFSSLGAKLSSLNSELTSGKISVADYKKEVKSLTSEYSKLVTIQQNRDVETYKQNAKSAEQEAKAQQQLTEAMAKGREQAEKSRQSEEERQRLAQNNAINKALEQEYQERQKNIQAAEKQEELDKQKALAFTKSASNKLSSAISKYSYGDSSDATAMMKQMNRGLSNFGDLSNVEGNITQLSSVIDKIIADLKVSHEQSLSALNQEIKSEQELQAQKDAFHKKNFTAIDLEIQKREEESKMVSSALKIQMEERQKQLSSMESSLKSYQDKAFDLSIKPDEANRFPEYQAQLDSINKAIKDYERHINSLQNKGSIIEQSDIDEANRLKSIIEELLKNTKKFSSGDKGFTNIGADKVLEKINNILEQNSRMSNTAKDQIKAYYNEIYSGNPTRPLNEILDSVYKIVQQEREAGRAGKSWLEIFKDKKIYSFIGQAASMFSFYDLISLGREGFQTIRELDTALVDLKKTTAMNSSELEEFYFNSNDVAKQMGVTTREIIDQASAWSRLGYNTKEISTQMAQLSSQFASISPGMDTDQAQEGLVSIMKAWDIDVSDVKSEIIDPINELGNNFAETNSDIVEGMKRSAAALSAVGTSYQDAFSLFTGAQEIMQNAEVTGRALRSISLRLRGYSEDSEDGFEELDDELKNITGDLINLTKTAKHTQGVSIFKEGSTTEFKSLVEYFGEINAIWDEMSQKQQNDFLQKAFGKTQAQAGAALIKNFNAVRDSINEIESSAGSADKEMEVIRQSIDFKINALKETWVGTAQELIDRGDIGKIVDGLTRISEAIGLVIDKAGLLGTFALGGGLFAGVQNIGKCRMSVRISNYCF